MSVNLSGLIGATVTHTDAEDPIPAQVVGWQVDDHDDVGLLVVTSSGWLYYWLLGKCKVVGASAPTLAQVLDELETLRGTIEELTRVVAVSGTGPQVGSSAQAVDDTTTNDTKD